MRVAPAAALEIGVADGRLRLLRQWEIEDIEWVQQTLAEYLSTGAQAAIEVAETPTLDVHRYLGASWKPICAFMITIAIPILWWCSWSLGWGLRSEKWPTVSGQVVHAHHEFHDGGHTSEIQYTYRVAGKQYRNDRIYFSGTPSDEKVIRLIETHPDGSSIPVRYSPNNAARCVLLPGMDVWDGLMAGVGGFLVLWAAYFWRRRPTAAQIELAEKYLVPATVSSKAKHSENEVIRRLFR